MRLPYPNRESGFTMIELMVTLTVMAILLAVATPSFVNFFDRYRLRGAADAVVSAISDARTEAVKTDRDVRITFKGSGSSWCMGASAAVEPTGGNPAQAPVPCDCTVSTACMVSGKRLAVETGAVRDVAIGTLPSDITFDSKLGTVIPLGASAVTLTSPRGKYDLQVQVNSLGQARYCRPAGKPLFSGVSTC